MGVLAVYRLWLGIGLVSAARSGSGAGSRMSQEVSGFIEG
jgi:hypothetical protein